MKVRNINQNCTELMTTWGMVLFSYGVPVAANTSGSWWRTEEHYSPTTSKHINGWLAQHGATDVKPRPQKWFNDMDWNG